jgi:hypothetical protein
MMTILTLVVVFVVVTDIFPFTTCKNNPILIGGVEGFSTVPATYHHPLHQQHQHQHQYQHYLSLSSSKGAAGQNYNNKALWLSSSVADDFMKTTPATTTKRIINIGEEDRRNNNTVASSTLALLVTSTSSSSSAATAAAAAVESVVFDTDTDTDTDAADADTVMTTKTTTTTNTRQYEFTPLQQFIRPLPFITTLAYLYNPIPLDTLTENIYSLIYNWNIAQQPLFEAEVAVFGFFISIIFFSSIHLFLGDEKTKQSRFDGKLPHSPFEWTVPKNWHLWFNPTASYLGSIYIYLHYFHDKPPLPIDPPTFGVLAIETIFGIILYDLCFMPIHYIMHNIKIKQIKRIHGYHHRSGSGSKKSLNSLETVQHSYIDGFLQVFVNILVQQISPFGGPKHVLSRLIHNLSVTYLLSEAHSGYSSLELMSHNIYPEIFGGAPRHETHHHNGRVYYQQYFKYIDDFFGFVVIEDDDDEKYSKAKALQTTTTTTTSSNINTTTDILITTSAKESKE